MSAWPYTLKISPMAPMCSEPLRYPKPHHATGRSPSPTILEARLVQTACRRWADRRKPHHAALRGYHLGVASACCGGDALSFVHRRAAFATCCEVAHETVSRVLAGLGFAWFAYLLPRRAGSHRVALLSTGTAAAGGMILAALAWATVPLSLTFGAFVGDPGLESGHAVLPQFGWMAFGLGAMLPAGVFIAIAARTADLLPRWLVSASYPIAVLVGSTVFLFMTVLLFVMWILAVITMLRSPLDR